MPPSDAARRVRIETIELAGIVLCLANICWLAIVARQTGGAPLPPAMLLVASLAVLWISRLISAWAPWLVPALLVTVAGSMLVLTDPLDGGPLSGPFGYANATAAYFMQAALGATFLIAIFRTVALRILAGVIALGLGAVPVMAGSRAAFVLLLVLPIGLAAALWPRVTRVAVGALAAVLVLAIGATVALGAFANGGGGLQTAATDSLSARRTTLWHEALVMMERHPLTGVGPGRFGFVSPTGSVDVDARWTHNEFLQQGAEAGVFGFLLLVGLFLWGFVRLWFVPNADALVALGAASLLILGLHAAIDYILHFAAVPIASAALIGTALAEPTSRSSR